MSRHMWEETALEQQQQQKKEKKERWCRGQMPPRLRHEEIQRNHSAVPN